MWTFSLSYHKNNEAVIIYFFTHVIYWLTQLVFNSSWNKEINYFIEISIQYYTWHSSRLPDLYNVTFRNYRNPPKLPCEITITIQHPKLTFNGISETIIPVQTYCPTPPNPSKVTVWYYRDRSSVPVRACSPNSYQVLNYTSVKLSI